MKELDLTIAVLSWQQPKTLRHTFESYRRNGLLDIAKEKLVFFNHVSKEDLKIASEYGFTALSAKSNIGIGKPFQQLVEKATSKYFLFLENDFMLVEDKETTWKRLNDAIELLENNITAVHLRHRYHYGDPNNFLRALWQDKIDKSVPSLSSIYYLSDSSETYKGYVEKIHKETQDVFVVDAKYSGYTNNPTIYKTTFLKENFLPLKFSIHDVIENNVNKWWVASNFKVAQGTGLFKHNPLEFSGSGFAENKRIKNPIKNWSHYIIRFGIRRNTLNLFVFQFLPTLFKININIANRFMINLSLGVYESV